MARGEEPAGSRRAGPTERRGGCLRSCLSLLILAAAAAVILWLVAPPLLTAGARWLIVEDPLERADAAVALSGGDGERLHASLALFRQGKADAILIVGPDQPLLRIYTGEDSLSQGEAKRRILLRRGVPPEKVILALGANSTLDEAQAALREARARGFRSLVIVTDPFHTRRARATFRYVFRNEPVRIAAYHLPPDRSQFRAEKWWTRERDTMAVLTEWVKTVFYAWNHRIWPWS